MNEEETKKTQQWAKLIAKAWADEDFKARLVADPVAVLRAEGIDVPDGKKLKVVEDTEDTSYIVIPVKPLMNDGQMLELERRR
ncbi:MAG: nitrile hydratase subunit alpha [Proteobacteria bacterium]|nr:nitrile hydratase subunit alpha [Pseudomonadota bacterium]